MIPWLALAVASLPAEPRPVVARDPVLAPGRRFSDELVERIEADDANHPFCLIPGPREAPPGRPGCPRCAGTGTATRTATGAKVPGHRCPVCRKREVSGG